MFHSAHGSSSSTICGISSFLIEVMMMVANALYVHIITIVVIIVAGTNVK
jgi:hypothetical protein